MGVRGLTTYLHHDSRNFEDYSLHNTTLIIDAANFVCQLYLKSTLYTQFNGEYVGLFACVAEFIDCLRRCMVHPIFVFDGCHQPLKLRTQLQRNKYRLQTCRSLNARLNSSPRNATDPSFRIYLVPPLIMAALADALVLLNVEFVTSDRESDHDAICLAVHFNCPVLSDDSDFFITIPESETGTCLLPMCYFTARSYTNSVKCQSCTTTKKLCRFIPCKKFLPHGPGLNGLPPNLRPLLACFLGNDYVHPQTFSRCFPVSNERAVPLSKAATDSMLLKRRRSLIHALIKWMCNFSGNAEQIIERLLSRYPTSDRPWLKLLLNKAVQTYCVDIDLVVNSFSKYLNGSALHAMEYCSLPDDDSDDHAAMSSDLTPSQSWDDTISEDCSMNERDIPNDTHCVVETSNVTSVTKEEQIHFIQKKFEERFVATSKWPDNMVDAFRKYLIMPLFMDSIFSEASVLTCCIESLNDHKSVYSSSASLRRLIYGLILGMENQCMPNHPHRLSGVKNWKNCCSVTEYDRRGSRDLRPRKIHIEPIILEKSPEACNKFTESYLGISTTWANSEWLKWLAVLIVVYHRSSPESTSRITTSVTALSFGIIAISSFLNEDILRTRPKLLKSHYSKCAGLLNPPKNKETKLENRLNKLDIHAVHDYGELQVIYVTLTTLGSVLDFLVSEKTRCNNRCIPLPPVPVIFPSGYLFHQVYLYIASCDQSERFDRATSLFEKLLFSDKGCNYLSQANTLFESYIRQLVEVQANLKLPVRETNPIVTSKHIQPANNTARLRKASQCVPKAHKAKNEQALIEERITQLMLENDLSD